MQPQKGPTVDVTKLYNEACSCGNKFWEKAVILKKIPGIYIGQSQATLAPVEIYRCDKCREVHPDLLPAIKEPEPVKN